MELLTEFLRYLVSLLVLEKIAACLSLMLLCTVVFTTIANYEDRRKPPKI